MKACRRCLIAFWSILAGIALLLNVDERSFGGDFFPTGSMQSARDSATATLLKNGKVLVVGGLNDEKALATAEIYNPATKIWTNTAPLMIGRYNHTATLLLDGTVLVVGGTDSFFPTNALADAEIYDPALGTWTNTAPIPMARARHTATLLNDGTVLVVGGATDGFFESISSVELYNPTNRTWTALEDYPLPVSLHTSTLLPDGRVLVTGGQVKPTDGFNYSTDAVELFDPLSGSWLAVEPMSDARMLHMAAALDDGRVLVAGGYGETNTLASAEIFDPASETWTNTGAMLYARQYATLTLLTNHALLVAGGDIDNGFQTRFAETYDPGSGTWTATGSMITYRDSFTATLLSNGNVLIAGGFNSIGVLAQGTNSGAPAMNSAELYDPTTGWKGTASMDSPMLGHSATLLPNGKALVVSGHIEGINDSASQELFDPNTSNWSSAGPGADSRYLHTATLLADGRVLLAGGYGETNALDACLLYDPGNDSFTTTGTLHAARYYHTATLLPNGKVLVVGGESDVAAPAYTEIFDPVTGLWTLGGEFPFLFAHTATLLPNGKVLVAGGINVYPVDAAELYDPATGLWSDTGSLNEGRADATATLLPNGKVLIAGGYTASGVTNTAELYDPITGTWAPGASMFFARQAARAVLMPDGRVLVAGGAFENNAIAESEIYDPMNDTWTFAGNTTIERVRQTMTLLPDGQVLQTGGTRQFAFGLNSAEIYTSTNIDVSVRPRIDGISSPLAIGDHLTLVGSQFLASGSINYPRVQLRNAETGQIIWLTPSGTNWSATNFISTPLTHFPPGYAWVTVFRDGIPSVSQFVSILVPAPVPVSLTDLRVLPSGAFQFNFTNAPGAIFGVLTTTNVSLPLTNWIPMGGVVEISPGRFQFTDLQATNGTQHFYRLRAP